MTVKGISRTQSTVVAIDPSGEVLKGFYIWTALAPAVKLDPDLCYAKCLVLPGSTTEIFNCRQVEPADCQQRIFEVPVKLAYNVNSNIDPLQYPDIGAIPHTNEAAVLDFVRQRYMKGQIFTEAKPLLVTINPFKNLDNALNEHILHYRDTINVDNLSPHVFSIARIALENFHDVQKSQTIIVSGESGAGKTEAVKQVMRYFAAARNGKIDTKIQTAVLAANPVLEAFGNAKTIRNNNSSRFGRFMQLQVQIGGGIEYGSVSSFLLEKSRILTQDSMERSYHIFYQLLKGANQQQKQCYNLLNLCDYKFLNNEVTEVEGINDAEDWIEVQKSLNSMSLNSEEKNSVFSIVSGILLLGNVDIQTESRQGIPDAAYLNADNKMLLQKACELLFLDANLVEKGILIKISKAGTEEVKGSWKKSDAVMLKDSFCKGIYDCLFNWIIEKLNSTIKPPDDFSQFIALLDIFGFEVFNNNSLEQLLINTTNEMLQKNFIDAVFDRETKLYREEGISSADLVWTTNAQVIEVLIGKRNSIMTALEDQCLAPTGTDEKFVAATHFLLKENQKLVKPKVFANINFIIEHTIGQIAYCANNFLFKNTDVLRPELVEVVKQSSNSVASGSFKNVVVERGKLAKGQLIGSQFMSQLTNLIKLINMTEPHFIRCVKPNEEKAPLKFVSSRVLVQLHSLSILEAIQLRGLGYAYRRPFDEFLYQFRFINLEIVNQSAENSKRKCQLLLETADAKSGWQLGKTMIFLKNFLVKELTYKQRQALSAWVPVVDLVEAIALRRLYRRQYELNCPCLIRIQARCRQRLAGKVQAPSHNVNIKGW